MIGEINSKFLRDDRMRPHEPLKVAFKLDRIRNWKAWLECMGKRLTGLLGPAAPHVFEFMRRDRALKGIRWYFLFDTYEQVLFDQPAAIVSEAVYLMNLFAMVSGVATVSEDYPWMIACDRKALATMSSCSVLPHRMMKHGLLLILFAPCFSYPNNISFLWDFNSLGFRCKQWMADTAYCERLTYLTADDIRKLPGPMPQGFPCAV